MVRRTRDEDDNVLRTRKAKMRLRRDEHGNVLRYREAKVRLKYYLRRDAWNIIQTRLGFIHVPLPKKERPFWSQDEPLVSWEELKRGCRQQPPQEPGFQPIEEKNQESERRGQEAAFDGLLSDPATKRRFKSLPAGFKMTKEVEEFADEVGPLFLQRLKWWLIHDIDPAMRKMFELKAERDRLQQLEKTQRGTLPLGKPPLTREQITVKDFARSVLNKMRRGPLNR